MEGGEDPFPLAERKESGCAASEENRFWGGGWGSELELGDEGFGEAVSEFEGGLGVKRAIVAFARAEGDVRVKAPRPVFGVRGAL